MPQPAWDAWATAGLERARSLWQDSPGCQSGQTLPGMVDFCIYKYGLEHKLNVNINKNKIVLNSFI